MIRLQLAVVILLTLGGLLAASALTDHCAQDARFCGPERGALMQGSQQTLEDTNTQEKMSDSETSTARAVLAHAFEPLPMSLETGTTRNFVLPPGQSMLDMATETGRIPVDAVSLIAVVRQEGVRYALVRLPDGRILRLSEGDALDGGTVAAISDDALYMIGPDLVPRAFVLGG